MDDLLPEEYARLVQEFTRGAANEFRLALGDAEAERRTCEFYFSRGLAQGLSVGELVDFLGVSTPSVLDQANYSDADAQRVMDSLASMLDQVEES